MTFRIEHDVLQLEVPVDNADLQAGRDEREIGEGLGGGCLVELVKGEDELGDVKSGGLQREVAGGAEAGEELAEEHVPDPGALEGLQEEGLLSQDN